MKKILFVCTGNSCRSVMAEGLFRKITGSRAGEFSVVSAGISAPDGFPATEETLTALKEEGVDVSGHRSKHLTAQMVREADRIFVMEKMHRDAVLQLVPEAKNKISLLTENHDIPDPIRMSGLFYRNVLSTIRDSVKKIVEGL
ncbi:MAG: low molecular weight protein arginine phosphatase [Candidatus Omnitrophota bacterium]